VEDASIPIPLNDEIIKRRVTAIPFTTMSDMVGLCRFDT
jgi:hypothetical protein